MHDQTPAYIWAADVVFLLTAISPALIYIAKLAL